MPEEHHQKQEQKQEQTTNQAPVSVQTTTKVKVKRRKHALSNYTKYSGMAFQMLAVMLLGAFGGVKLDELLGTSPLFTIVLIIFAVAMAMIMVIRGLTQNDDD